MAVSQRSSVQDQIADVTECSICTEIFTNPKILPCVHTFCLHCLEKYGKDQKPGEEMVCPLCRKEFFIPDGGFSLLPNNFFIGKLVEIGKLTSTPTNKSLCALCPEDEEVLAQLFCIDCEQNLCTRCGNGHKKSRVCQRHQVVELGSQPKIVELNLRNSYCDQNPGEMIKMFCYEDNVAICLVCCVESHQSHRCVNVNKVAGEFMEQLKDSTRKVANRLSECVEFGETLDKFKKEFQERVILTEESICDAVNKLKKLLDQHANKLIQDLKSVRDRNLKAFEVTRQDIDRFRVMIDSFSRYSEELLSQGSPVDICRNTNQMLNRAQELETLPVNCSGESFICDTIYFNPSHIENPMKPNAMNNTVGELHVTQSSDWSLKFGRETSVCRDGVERCRVEVRPGKFLILMRGDITKCSVDAIVIEAYEDLNHVGKVSAAIARAAGTELDEDCRTHIELGGPLSPGKACVTRAGKLRCKKVIHAVRPRWKFGNEYKANTLALAIAVDSSLRAAGDEGLNSVAMPLMGIGMFGLTLELASDTIVNAVTSYIVCNSSKPVRKVFFIDDDSQAVDCLERKLKMVL